MSISRRAALAALGGSVPLALPALTGRPGGSAGPPPALRFRPFEEAVREAFAAVNGEGPAAGQVPVRRIEVGFSDLLRAGVQGCHNDRPFAGFPAGHLRIVRTGAEPGPAVGGVRLYVSTVDVAVTGGRETAPPSRGLDFTTIPPAPRLQGQPAENRTASGDTPPAGGNR